MLGSGDGLNMSKWILGIGTFFSLCWALFAWMGTIFAIAGLGAPGASQAMSKLALSYLNGSIYLAPVVVGATCLLPLILYWQESVYQSYWWFALPPLVVLIHFSIVFMSLPK